MTEHEYRSQLMWEGNLGGGTATYDGYGRDFRLRISGAGLPALCAKNAITVVAYTDDPTGTLVLEPEGGGHFEIIDLHPVVRISAGDPRGRSPGASSLLPVCRRRRRTPARDVDGVRGAQRSIAAAPDRSCARGGARLLRPSRRSDSFSLTESGEAFLREWGFDLDALRGSRRPLCRTCLDWSERRFHLGGSLGAAILQRIFSLRWAKRMPDSRAVTFTAAGDRSLRALLELRGTIASG